MARTVEDLVYERVVVGSGDARGRDELRVATQLHQLIGGLQSQPAEMADPLLDAVHETMAVLPDLRATVGLARGEPLLPADWMVLTYLARTKHLLRTGWEAFYGQILPAYPELEGHVLRLRELLGSGPFDVALQRLEDAWSPGADRLTDLAAVAFAKAAALLGLLGSTGLYRRVASLLDPRSEFLLVYAAATCLRLPDVADRAQPWSWSEAEYASLGLLDAFASEPGESAWG